jgi:hypothetical protein
MVGLKRAFILYLTKHLFYKLFVIFLNSHLNGLFNINHFMTFHQ